MPITLVEAVIQAHYEGLVPSVKAALAVVASLALEERALPISLVLETPSGYGKSTILQLLFPLNDEMSQYVYRSDKFTPKSFVSHAANIRVGRLAKNDLLPKLPNKVLITKELAPLFRGREEEMSEHFAILIGVLDGKGYLSDSGLHGQRGYGYDIVFNWLGATTPIPDHTHRLMSQLGTRLLFYEVPAFRAPRELLLQYAQREDYRDGNNCQQVVNTFVTDLFQRYPVSSIKPGAIAIPPEHLGRLVAWSEILSRGRAQVNYERFDKAWEPVSAATPEGNYKLIQYFKCLVRGHALIHERFEVNESDMQFIGHVALSSIPGYLRKMVRLLLAGETITSVQTEQICNVSRPTALRYLHELELLKLADRHLSSHAFNDPSSITLSEAMQSWFHSTTLTISESRIG